MLQLKKLSDNFIKEYQEKIWSKIKPVYEEVEPGVKSILSESIIKDILIDPPNELKSHHDGLIPKLGPWNDLKEFQNYFKISKKKEADTNAEEKRIIESYKHSIDILCEIFDYRRFISGSQSTSYWIAEELDCNTCTYCNRNYTLTVSKDEKSGKRNNETRITRPQFDHWFSQSQHPILALSIYNLIPSCSTCNSDIKGSLEFDLNKHIHPYVHIDEYFTFSYINVQDDKYTVKIDVQGGKMSKTLEQMKLEKLYKAHDEFELKDLIDLSKKYSKNYINQLFNKTFKKLNLEDKEVYKMIFGIDIENHQNRVMSKYKHDIIQELRKKMK